jgi:hypothetical protein
MPPKPTCAGPRPCRTLCSNLAPTSKGTQLGSSHRRVRRRDGHEGARQSDFGRWHFGLQGVPVTALE